MKILECSQEEKWSYISSLYKQLFNKTPTQFSLPDFVPLSLLNEALSSA